MEICCNSWHERRTTNDNFVKDHKISIEILKKKFKQNSLNLLKAARKIEREEKIF